MKQVVILGAGISGLTAAWLLKKRFGSRGNVTLLEKNSRPGGAISTIKKDGFLFEQGPHSCRSQGAEATIRLIESLGIGDEVITPDRRSIKRYLLVDGHLRRASPLFIPFSPLRKGLMSALLRDWNCSRQSGNDESIETFSLRHFGEPFTSRLIEPIASGIYAGNIGTLSLQACFPAFYERQQEHGSLIRGVFAAKAQAVESAFGKKLQKSPFFSFREGLSTLVDSLALGLTSQIQLNCGASSIIFNKDGATITTESGKTLHADHLISALPASCFASLLGDEMEEAASLLKAMPTASLTAVSLGYCRLKLKYKGFGYLIAKREREKSLGVVWDSAIFPQQNSSEGQSRLTVMIGGSHQPTLIHEDDSHLIDIAIDTVKRHMGIDLLPDVIDLKRWHQAIPQYAVGHHALMARLEQTLQQQPSLTILGNSFHGVSLNSCIARAEQCAEMVCP